MQFYQPNEYLTKIEPVYSQLKQQLATIVPFDCIEHIGSTAIRGALSKGDLDILVRVSSIDFENINLRIQELGFVEKQGTLRTNQLCMLVSENYGIDVAIQLIERGSEFEDFIRFRDKLNADPKLVSQYNELKKNSIELSPNEYRAKKAEFIQRVLALS